VRFWTEKHSHSYGLKEDAYAETLQMCMKRNSVLPNRLNLIEIELRVNNHAVTRVMQRPGEKCGLVMMAAKNFTALCIVKHVHK
jgi:hypothetical protein